MSPAAYLAGLPRFRPRRPQSRGGPSPTFPQFKSFARFRPAPRADARSSCRGSGKSPSSAASLRRSNQERRQAIHPKGFGVGYAVEAGGVRPHGRRRPGQRGRGGQGRGRAPGPHRGRLRHDARGGGGRRHVAEAQNSRADTLHRQEALRQVQRRGASIRQRRSPTPAALTGPRRRRLAARGPRPRRRRGRDGRYIYFHASQIPWPRSSRSASKRPGS